MEDKVLNKIYCMYCGTELNFGGVMGDNSTWDGLHKECDENYGDEHKGCCNYCNKITVINRILGDMVKGEGNNADPKVVAMRLRSEADEIEKNALDFQRHYAGEKIQRWIRENQDLNNDDLIKQARSFRGGFEGKY